MPQVVQEPLGIGEIAGGAGRLVRGPWLDAFDLPYLSVEAVADLEDVVPRAVL